jgi:hypothetical protein
MMGADEKGWESSYGVCSESGIEDTTTEFGQC